MSTRNSMPPSHKFTLHIDEDGDIWSDNVDVSMPIVWEANTILNRAATIIARKDEGCTYGKYEIVMTKLEDTP